jgi:integrase
MPTVSLRVPKYCFHRARGLAYVRIRGKCRYLGKFNSSESKEAYGRLVAELATAPAAVAAPSSADRQALTIVELCADYLGFARRYYVKDGRPTDQMGTVYRAIRLLKELYAHVRAVEFGPLALQAVQERMVQAQPIHPKTKRPVRYSRSTINATCGCIKRMFKWATSKELIPVSAHQALATVSGLKKGRTTAREAAPIRPVSDEVVERTLPHLPPVVSDMVRFQRFTGARPGEVCQLRPMDLDRTGKVWQYRPASHKTEHHGRERIVFVGPKAQAILLPYLLRPADAWCFSPAESEATRHEKMRARRKTRVQPSQQKRRKARSKRAPSTRYDANAFRRAIAKAIAKANRAIEKQIDKPGRQLHLWGSRVEGEGTEPNLIPEWHPNQLRHSTATEIRRRFGLEAAQTVLGHAKADVTEVYAERDRALAADVMSKMG